MENDTVKKEKKEKMVKIRLPKTKDLTADVPVWVNRRSWIIKRGVEVEVPECVAEVLRNKERMEEVVMSYSAQVKEQTY